MGFSITACVITGIMFICYCVALGQFSHIMRCQKYRNYYDYYGYYSNIFCYSKSERYEASVGAGLGSCQLIYSIVVFFVALASAIYCCNAVCCGAPAVGAVSSMILIWFTLLVLIAVSICFLNTSLSTSFVVFFLDNEANNSNETQQGKEPQLTGGELISWLFYKYCQGTSLSHSYQEQIQRAVRMRIELGVSRLQGQKKL